MSNAVVTSSSEAAESELKQQIEAYSALNTSLLAYLEKLRTMKRDLRSVNENCKQLMKVNKQWTDLLKNPE